MKFDAILLILSDFNLFSYGNGPAWIHLASKKTEIEVEVTHENVLKLLRKEPIAFMIENRRYCIESVNADDELVLTGCLTAEESTRAFVESLASKGFQINEEGLEFHHLT